MRGTTRHDDVLAEISATGADAEIADPDRLGTILPLLGDVTVLAWLVGPGRLGALLERLVDTPVRGLVCDGSDGAALVHEASERWHIPVEIIEEDPGDHGAWLEAALRAVGDVVTG